MAGLFGLSFLPGSQDPSQQIGGSGNRVGASRNPMQEAVKILSLRLPKFYGSQSLAPAPLLSGQGGMGQPAARGNVTAQALAGLAGLPPSMAMPQAAAPMVMGGGGQRGDTPPVYNQPQAQSSNQPQSVAWPAPQPQQAYQQEQEYQPQAPTWAPPPPRVTPGQEAPAGQGLYDPPPLPPQAPVASPWVGRNPLKAQKYLDAEFWQQDY